MHAVRDSEESIITKFEESQQMILDEVDPASDEPNVNSENGNVLIETNVDNNLHVFVTHHNT